ncbi:MAG: putative membrane protein (TIGR02234 family) [Alpinimonas sp.]|jgi:uncharacterized membrane protein (TIGR02234 family)
MPMTGQKVKSRILLLVAICAVLAMVAWSQTWLTLTLSQGIGTDAPIPVTGQTMAPGLSALGLTGLALLAALSLAGPVFRIVLGTVQVALGAGIILSALGALNDAIALAAPALIDITGIQDIPALKALVLEQDLSPWPYVSVGIGIVTAIAGILILVTSRLWPRSGRKYAASIPPVDPGGASLAAQPMVEDVDASHARIDAWDDLSRGSDPTS